MTLLPAFYDQLSEAATRRARRPRLRALGLGMGPRRIARGVPIVASLAIAAVVAVVFLTSLHGSRGRVSGRRVTVSGPLAGNSRQALLDELAVLRRPQTAADRRALRSGDLPEFLRVPPRSCPVSTARTRPLCGGRVERRLVRRVTFGDEAVDLFPVTSSPTSRATGLRVTLGNGLYPYASTGSAVSAAAIGAHGIVLTTFVQDGIERGAIVVPDGVARVSLRFEIVTSFRAPTLPWLGGTWAVRSNVALLTIRGVTARRLHAITYGRVAMTEGRSCRAPSALLKVPLEAEMVWFSALGSVLKRTEITLPLYVTVKHPPRSALPRKLRCEPH